MDELNDQQKLFVCEYVKTFNATKAALAAGYSVNNPDVIGYQLLQKPSVAQATRAMIEKVGITPDRIKSTLAEMIWEGDIANLESVLESGGKSIRELRRQGVPTRLIKKIKVKRVVPTGEEAAQPYDIIEVELYDQQKAIELLGKSLAMFTDKSEITGGLSHSLDITIRTVTDDEFANQLDATASPAIDAEVMPALPAPES